MARIALYLPDICRIKLACIALLSALTVSACGGDDRKGDSQIAASVNDGEISVHQVQAVLARKPRMAAQGEGNTSVGNRVLDGLIDQELAAQKARAASLDKDPRVVQLVEAARREVLAQAWQELAVSNVRGATNDEVDRYYVDHPALFSQRRLYVLQETLVEGPADLIASALPEKVALTQSANELSQYLQRAEVRSQARTLTEAAEDLPLGLLSRIAPLAAGRSVAIPQGSKARIYTVLHATPAPVDRRQAEAAIKAFLANERKTAALAVAMQELRTSAKIGYQGSFAKPTPPAASAPASK